MTQILVPRDRTRVARWWFDHWFVERIVGAVTVGKATDRLVASLAEIGTVLFQSPDVLRRLGFNLRQVHEGFYEGDGQRPFDPEALADFFDRLDPVQLEQHQLALCTHLVQQSGELCESGTAVLDATTVTVPPGHFERAGGQIKACVLSLRAAGRVLPMLWDGIIPNF